MESTEGVAPARLRTLPSRLIGQVALSANRLVDRALAATGSRRYQYALLAALEEFGPASQADLGRRTGIDRSDVVAAVNELAARALVDRSPDPSDRRRNIITITEAGVRHLADLDRLLGEAQEALLEPLSPDERRRFVALLARLVEHHAGAGTAHT